MGGGPLSRSPPFVNNMVMERLDVFGGDNEEKAQQTLSTEQLRWLRRKCRDHRTPFYFDDHELVQFYLEESCDLAQAAAKALESWATDMDIGLGGYSAQGVTVNGQQIAQGMRTAAGLIRMENTRA